MNQAPTAVGRSVSAPPLPSPRFLPSVTKTAKTGTRHIATAASSSRHLTSSQPSEENKPRENSPHPPLGVFTLASRGARQVSRATPTTPLASSHNSHHSYNHRQPLPHHTLNVQSPHHVDETGNPPSGMETPVRPLGAPRPFFPSFPWDLRKRHSGGYGTSGIFVPPRFPHFMSSWAFATCSSRFAVRRSRQCARGGLFSD